MKYEGKLYAKINGRYIECTQTVEDLEKTIAYLQEKIHTLEGDTIMKISKGCNPA